MVTPRCKCRAPAMVTLPIPNCNPSANPSPNPNTHPNPNRPTTPLLTLTDPLTSK